LATASVILAVMAAYYSYCLEGRRLSLGPPASRPLASIRANAARQTADAVPWQDPFAVIDKSYGNASEHTFAPAGPKNTSGTSAPQPQLPPRENASATLIAGVILPGGFDPNAAEQRKRVRSAVMAGLARSGFASEDSNRIHYFLWPRTSPEERLSAALPLPAHDQEEAERDQKCIIAYEWFSQLGWGKEKQILVLWLNEHDFGGEPLRKLSGLKRFLYANALSQPEGSSFKLIGPSSSALLEDMVKERRKFIYAAPYRKAFGRLSEKAIWPGLYDVQFFAYGATADDCLLLGDMAAIYGTAQHFLGASGVHLERTIATERTLARGLVRELRRRKIIPGSTGDTVLISDRDSYSGRSVPDAVELAFGHLRPGRSVLRRGGDGAGSIHKLTYLRGLDGLLAGFGTKTERARGGHAAQGEKQAGAADLAGRQDAVSSSGPSLMPSQDG
jgi:hypothetical protein